MLHFSGTHDRSPAVGGGFQVRFRSRPGAAVLIGVGCCLLVWTPLLEAATKVWIGGSSGWSTPAAWSPAGVPDAADEIQVDAGSIQLDVAVTISNRLTWSGGTIRNGALRIAAGATAELNGSGDKALQNVSLVNEGALRVNQGRLAFLFTGSSQYATLTNQVGGLIEIVDTAQVALANPSGYTPAALALVNEGVIRKTGAGTGAVAMVPLANRGRVEVVAGLLQWTGGGISPGTFHVPEGSAMDLHTGTYALAGSRWEGSGAVRLRNDATVTGAFHAENFGITGGAINGEFDVDGAFEWTGGNLVGARVRLGAGQHQIAGSATKEMRNAGLSNAGQLLVTGSSVGLRFIASGQSASITNEAAGTITLTGNAVIEQRNPSGYTPAHLVLVNAGTLRSSGIATNRIQDIPLNNSGVAEVEEGRLVHRGGGDSTGRWTVAAGAVSEWQSGRYRLTEATVDGPGSTLLNGTLTLEGSASVEEFEFKSGTMAGACELRRGFRWTGGSLVGCSLRLGAGNHWIAGDGGQTLQNTVVVNEGRLIAEGTIVGCNFSGSSQYAVLTNETSGVLELRADSRIRQVNPSGYTPLKLALVNQGLMVSAAEGTNWVESIPLHNQGTIEITEGTLRQTGGGVSPGEVEIASGAAFKLSGGIYDLDGGHWTGPGMARIVASSRLLGVFEAENFGLAGGDLDGTFDVSGGFEWTGGWLVNAEARFGRGNHRIAGAGGQTLRNTVLRNAGHLVAEGTIVGCNFSGSSQYAVLTNETSGVLELRADSRIRQVNPSGYTPLKLALVNQGLMVSAAEGTNWVESIPLHNEGTIQIPEGMLRHTGGGTSPGRFEVGAAGRFEFSAGTYQLEGSQWSGPGAAAIVGTATVQGAFAAEDLRLEKGDLSGACEISGGFHWTGGNLLNAQVRLGPGEHRISGPDSKVLHRSTLTNAGHLVVEATTVALMFNGGSQTAAVDNGVGGQLDLLGGARIELRNPSGYTPLRMGVFNDGVLRKVGGGTAVLAGVPLVNRASSELMDGVMRVEGNATFEAGGKLTVGLGAEPGLQITGTATLGGVLEVATAPGFEVTAGATYTPLSAGVISSQFVNDVALNPGHIYEYSMGYSAKLLTLTAEGGLMQPIELIGPRLTEGVMELDIIGRSGLQYGIESSTNLVTWQLDFTTNGPADTLTVVDPRVPLVPSRYYRVGVLP
ncbi:MAG TPA: hypothetical protein PKM73_08595 [Verrucomicrobiota bacterium]|nr:hypothetical protein [Verrucomicrobiota bacterium]